MTVQAELVIFYPNRHEMHAFPGHPERPARIEAICASLLAAGWWEPFPKLDPITIPDPILYKIHDPAWLSELSSLSRTSGFFDINTYVTPASYNLAIRAAGGTAAVAGAVWREEAKRGFSLARPPGHHATRRQGGGFCLLNNIAIASEILIQQEGVKRLAIIDLDLHHGNGTQDIFWRREDVLYISTHQMPLFPGTGRYTEIGEGKGYGATANFPLPPGSGDIAFRTVLDELIMPLLERFSPEIILISYGFDPHWREPNGNLLLSAGEYGRMISSLTHWADEHCKGRIVLVLEGGYDLEAASACSCAVTAALLSQPWDDPIGASPDEEDTGWEKMVEQAKILWSI